LISGLLEIIWSINDNIGEINPYDGQVKKNLSEEENVRLSGNEYIIDQNSPGMVVKITIVKSQINKNPESNRG
jgi:hypothetical protein